MQSANIASIFFIFRKEKGNRMKKLKKGLLLGSLLCCLIINENQNMKNIKDKSRDSKLENVLISETNETYTKEELILMVENIGMFQKYYFVENTKREPQYISTSILNEDISINLEKTVYESITNPNHEIVFNSNIYMDNEEEKIIGRDGTIYLNQTGILPASNFNENGILTNFTLPEKYQEKNELTKRDLLEIETIYNNNYINQYLIENDQFDIDTLFLIEYDGQFLIMDKNSITYTKLNPISKTYSHVYSSISIPTLGLRKDDEQYIRLCSTMKEEDYELVHSLGNIKYYELKSYLTEEQIKRGYINREEVSSIEAKLSLEQELSKSRK